MRPAEGEHAHSALTRTTYKKKTMMKPQHPDNQADNNNLADGASAMTILADGGSTKTAWALLKGGATVATAVTEGVNPVHTPGETIYETLRLQLPQSFLMSGITRVEFYGAGCIEPYSSVMRGAIARVFGINEGGVTVDSDIVGAARALFGSHSGIACILGTGSNSCLFIDGKIQRQVPPMGYILGDEGSGAALGRAFLNALYKRRLPQTLMNNFGSWSHLTYNDVIDKVYRQPNANRFLASLSPFIALNTARYEPLRDMVKECFRLFFRNNIDVYDRHDLRIGAVGSIAWHYGSLLREVAGEEHYAIDRIIKSPLTPFSPV